MTFGHCGYSVLRKNLQKLLAISVKSSLLFQNIITDFCRIDSRLINFDYFSEGSALCPDNNWQP